MNKKELITKVHMQLAERYLKSDCARFVDLVLDEIGIALANEEDVTLYNLGTFKVHQNKARVGRNPQTGEQIDIPAKMTVKFKASKILKDALNDK